MKPRPLADIITDLQAVYEPWKPLYSTTRAMLEVALDEWNELASTCRYKKMKIEHTRGYKILRAMIAPYCHEFNVPMEDSNDD